ncbi:ribosomal L7Ae/L30e/S12e/Gadd45 family protein [Candidatus Woesearchaeota archaeon]|nr:ribosomal L7Ae/L30e/S12e/Gadd45 family protein [Candidatus Woesearchaeota archaeon]
MAQKTESTEELLKSLQSLAQARKLIIGSDRVLKELRKGGLKKVLVAKNCPSEQKGDILHYAHLTEIPLVALEQNNEELGVLCKKNFFVAVVGIPAV